MNQPVSVDPPAVQLAWPFAVLGLVGGWITADILNMLVEGMRLFVVLTTSAVSAGLGAILSRYLRSRPFPHALGTLFAVALAGAVNGGLLGLLIMKIEVLFFGAGFGIVCSIPFLPVLGSVVAVARRVGRARQGSLVDASDRRKVWITAMVFLAPSVLLTFLPQRPSTIVVVEALLSLVAALVIAVSFARDLGALLLARGLAEREARFVSPDSDLARETIARVDLGLGDELHQEVARAGSTYREHTRPTRLIRGNPAAAVAALRWNVGVGVAALLIALASIGLRVASSWPR